MTPTTEQPLKLLISYHYWKRVDLTTLPRQVQLFGDSGAFSAHTLGAEITLDTYMAWVHKWKHRLECYAGLDDLTSPKRSIENYHVMRANGLDPLPTFHYGEDWSVLDEYMKHTHYIALGGMVGESTKSLMQWAIQCFKRAKARGEGHGYHGFGLTKVDALKLLPWYSVDSSSWGAGHRYGRVFKFEPLTGRMRTAGRETLALDPALRGIGLRQGLELGGIQKSLPVVMHNAEQWRLLEQYLRRRHGEILLDDRAPGLHLYLVDGSQTVAKALAKEFYRKQQEGA